MLFRKRIVALTIGTVLLFFGGVFSRSNIYTFSTDVEITEAPPDDGNTLFFSSGQHYTAFRGDTVYVVWQESRSFTPPLGTRIFFAKSTDGGQTFGPNVPVTPAGAVNPGMKVDTAGIIYVAYQHFADIYFTKSTDGGLTFTPGAKVNDDTIPQIGQEKPAIAVNNKGQIFVAWIDRRTNPQSIFTSASYDSGRTFGPNVNVDPGLRDRDYPDIAADDSGRVYVGYAELLPNVRQIALARSADSGMTFDFHTFVSDVPADGSSCCAVYTSLVCDGKNQIGIVWTDSRFNDQVTLRFSVSTDYGQAFSPSVRVDDDPDVSDTTLPSYPSTVWRNGIFYVAWGEYRVPPGGSTQIPGIYLSYNPDGGQSFVPSVYVNAADTTGSGRGLSSLSFNEEGRAFAAWLDTRYQVSFDPFFHIFGSVGNPAFVKGDLNLGQPFPCNLSIWAEGNCCAA